MNLVALPAFSDNYIWMVHDGREAVVVDPGDSAPVFAALQSLHLSLTGILVTHHHPDHVGGIAALRPSLKGDVHGPASESIPGPMVPHRGGDTVTWNGLTFQVIDVPGHTAGHIAYFLPASGTTPPRLFCGDTLFSGGCGRLFEGTPAQMHASLETLAALPGETQVCCAHEYTLSNLRFASAADPDNAELVRHVAVCERLRRAGEATLPSTLALERQINPFLRCDQPALIAAVQHRGQPAGSPVQVLAALREWKNQFQ